MRLAILSQSARLYAELAQREGFEVLAIDAFADTDTREAAHAVWPFPALVGQLIPEDIGALMDTLDQWQPDGVLIGSGFEANIECYAQLHQRYCVLGNTPETVQRIKQPEWLQAYCAAHDVLSPEIRLQAPLQGQWLYKQAGQCGGSHVRKWSEADSTSDGGYWQALQAGQAVGALFVVNEQAVTLIGVHALQQHSGQYTYAGATRLHDVQLVKAMQHLLQALVPDSGLTGINSLDAMWQNGQLHVLEINPRLSASMRLYADLPLIKAHIASCQNKTMPALPLNDQYASHCIAYARQALNTASLDFPDWVEDRPYGHMTIAAGQPVCSLYAEGRSANEVQQQLQHKKTRLEKLWGTYVCEHIEFNIH